MSGMFPYQDGEDYQVVIFAASQERANEIYLVVEERLWLLPEGWLGSEMDAWWNLGLVRHQAEAERRNVEGIGVYDPSDGWTILPLDYEKIGISPPPRRITQ